MLRRVIAVACVAAACAALPLTPAGAASGTANQATFGSRTIVLNDGSWDGARACAVVAGGTQCFASEAAMDAWLAADAAAGPGGATTFALTCSSSLRLYQHGGFGGTVLYLSTRALWLNLSAYGFNNITSSFKVGACSSYLADGTNGGGSWYPGSGAYASVPVMIDSWNDRFSSAYLV